MSIFIIVAAIAVAAADPVVDAVPAAPAAERTTKAYGPRVLPASRSARAAEVCDLSGCDTGRLGHFQIEWSGTADAPAGIDVEGRPAVNADADAGCGGRTFDVVISAPKDRDLVIDWEGATFVVGGQAIAAVPGFARRASSSLTQRTIRVPAATTYAETAFPIHEDACLFPPPVAGSFGATTTLEVVVRLGDVRESVRFTTSRRAIEETEARAFSLIPSPPAPPPGEAPTKTWPVQMATDAGIGAASLGLLTAGVATIPVLAGTAPPGFLATILCCSACGVAIGGGAGAGIGGYLDREADHEVAAYVQLAKPYAQWRATRKRLGLDVPTPAAKQAF